MKRFYCRLLVFLFLLISLTGCSESVKPYYIPPEGETISDADTEYIEVYCIPVALVTGKIDHHFSYSTPEKELMNFRKIQDSFRLRDENKPLDDLDSSGPFSLSTIARKLTERQYEAMTAAYQSYLPDLLAVKGKKLFPAVLSIEFELQGEEQYLAAFHVQLQESRFPKQSDWTDSEEYYALREELLSIQTCYNEFRGAEETRDLEIDWLGEEKVLKSETIPGDTEQYLLPLALFDLEEEKLDSYTARDLAKKAEDLGIRQIFIPDENALRFTPHYTYVQVGEDDLEAVKAAYTGTVEQKLKEKIPEDSYVKDIRLLWTATHNGVLGLVMEIDTHQIPSGWEPEDALMILTQAEPTVNNLNRLYKYKYHYPNGMLFRIVDAETGETLAAWRNIAEDVCTRIS